MNKLNELEQQVLDAMNVPLHVPRWARWMAQDAGGKWWFYENTPCIDREFACWEYVTGRFDQAYLGEPNPDWRDTLYEVY